MSGNFQLNLSDELQQFVNSQVLAGHYESPTAYVETLISRAKKGNDRIEQLLIEGLGSGDAVPLDSNEWGKIREEVQRRLKNG
jgi:antitoxin ParD1/3/4